MMNNFVERIYAAPGLKNLKLQMVDVLPSAVHFNSLRPSPAYIGQ